MTSRDLSLEVVRATEFGAIASSYHVGKGDKIAGDKAAVDAIRYYLNTIDFDGTVVIGEGEKDEAPMLYNGEKVGTGKGLKVDLAIDPVEGTDALANGQTNTISTIALSEPGSMLEPGSSFYMKKIVVEQKAKDVIDIKKSATENLKNIAQALNKNVSALTVFVLDRPRHEQLIKEIRQCGVRILLNTHGDVTGAISAAMPDTNVDVLLGIGGTPEAIISAAAMKAIGGGMQCQRAPQSESEKERLLDENASLDEVMYTDDLVKSESTFFAATGITGSAFLHGVRYDSNQLVRTQSIVMRSYSGTIRYIEGLHNLEKKLRNTQFKMP